ncbi:MAG: TolC family protein [Sedimentisphaerales bacterium]|nr:TolC family protein [Sedimentisphaerales bacterium]
MKRQAALFNPDMKQADQPGLPPRISGELTLQECVDLALEHNKNVQQARERLAEAEGQILEAASTALPDVTLSGYALAQDAEAESFGSIPAFDPAQLPAGQPLTRQDIENATSVQSIGTTVPKELYQWQIFARQPLYLGGLAAAALDAAVAYSYSVEQQLRQSRQLTEFNVRRSYLAVLLAAELEAVARQAQIDARENLRLVEAKFKAGEALKFELLRAQVRLRSTDAEVIQRHNDYVTSLAALFKEMGVSQQSDMTMADVLLYDPVQADNEHCMAMALTRRPDLLIGEATLRLLQDNIASEKSQNRPKVYLQGTYQEDKPASMFGGANDWRRSMSGGISVEWNIFDGFQTNGRVVQAQSKLHQQEIEQRKLEEQVQYEVTEASLNLQSNQEYVLSQQGNVENARESLRLAQINFREGSGTSLDVITAETSLASARAAYIQAVHAYQLSHLQLKAVMGVLGEDIPKTVGEEQ